MTITENLKEKLFIGFSIILAIGMVIMSYDWAPSNDEKFNVPYADLSLDYYTSLGKNDTVLTTTTKMDPVMKFYGIAIELPAHAIHRVFGVELFGIRHAMIALVSFFYIFFGALIAKRIGGWNAGFIAMIFLILTPRIFGEAFNNPKDPTYCATTLFSIYTFFRFYDSLPRPTWKDTLWLGLGIAVSLLIRISGLMTDFIFVVFLGVEYYTLLKSKETVDVKDIAKKVFAALGGGYILGIIFWPAMINSPITMPFEALGFLKNLPVTIKNLFEGKYLESTQIPWYYLPKYFMICNPEIILLGIILGLVFFLKMAKIYSIRRLLFILVSSFMPLFLIIYSKTGLLTGWRHGYFIYIPLVIFSALFFSFFIFNYIKRKRTQYLLIALLGLTLVPTVIFMIKNYPLFYVYFNPTFGGVKKALGNYELDYYSQSTKPAVDWLLANEPNIKNLTIASNNPYQIGNLLEPKIGKKNIPYIRYRERNDQDWDYAILTQSFVDAEYLKNGHFPPSGTVKSIEVDGVPIAAIVKRTDKSDYKAKLLIDSNKFSEAIPFLYQAIKIDSNNEIAWTNLGFCQLNTGQAANAEISLKKALEISPENLSAQNFLGYAYLQNGNVNYAQYVFLQMIEQNPNNPEPYKVLAQIYQQQGNTQSAQQYMSVYQQIMQSMGR